jgi:hypothetical protein
MDSLPARLLDDCLALATLRLGAKYQRCRSRIYECSSGLGLFLRSNYAALAVVSSQFH